VNDERDSAGAEGSDEQPSFPFEEFDAEIEGRDGTSVEDHEGLPGPDHDAMVESDRGADGEPTGIGTDPGERAGDPFESMEDVFEQREIAEIDPDVVWEELTAVKARGSVTETGERTYAEVSKHSYCEHCEWFTEPPEVRCTHEGTEILEFLDMETVRLVDCPVVAERREIEKEG